MIAGNSIVLIGMMGSGKSTVGKLLAEELGYQFVDSDSYIEEKEGRIIAEIFASNGEEYFRQIESNVLVELLGKNEYVIACGGGVVESPKNIELFRKCNNVFHLDARPSILYNRISGDKSRPKLSTYAEFEKLYAERRKKYSICSKWMIPADRNPIDVVYNIVRYL